MKTIDVKNQPQLSVGRIFEIAVNGIRYRLFRSSITVVVIAVAIAFMMNILCEAISVRAAGAAARERTARQRTAALWAAQLSSPGTLDGILGEVASAQPGSPLLTQAQRLGGLSETDLPTYVLRAGDAIAALRFFEGIDYGRRRVLVGKAMGVDIFDELQDAGRLQSFEETLQEKMRSLRLPYSFDRFHAFLTDWPKVKAQTVKIQQGREAAIAKIGLLLDGEPLLAALRKADGPLGAQIEALGFTAFDQATRGIVAEQARQQWDMQVLQDSVGNPACRAFVVSYFPNLKPGDVTNTVLWRMLRDRHAAELHLTKMQDVGMDVSALTPARVVSLSHAYAESAQLERVLQNTIEAKGGLLGMGERMQWLVVISLLVCVVGIANAMLMSVTERFREIATLKCLGALDNFIMILFVIEASLLGLVGGVAGSLAGSIIGFGRMSGILGGLVFAAFPVGPWVLALFLSIAIGIVLAALAGVYPSYIAARLAPMEAMRIE